MKRLALFAATLLLAITTSYQNSEAYYLDSPHNESNNIICATCHNNPAWFWPGFIDPADPTNPDKTTRNAICNNCHGTKPEDVIHAAGYVDGPDKELHASSTTDESHGVWSTQCTDCHDPHFQGQLDWNLSDEFKLYLATGQFTSNPSPSGLNTTITFSGPNSPQPGFEDPSTWNAKGGVPGSTNMDPTRSPDGTRGLILVPYIADPTETYEIIDVTGSTMTVKGTMGGNLSGLTFGVFYGQSIKSFMLDAHGTGFKNIKLFKPEAFTGDLGGLIDETPAASPPVGLCQVCHETTLFWKADGSVNNGAHNPANNPCKICHDIYGGLDGAADHTTFIIDDNETGNASNTCSNCHSTIVDNPVAHTNGCLTCHETTFPDINSNAMPNGQSDSDSGDSTTNLTDAAAAPYTQYSFTGTIGGDNTRLFDGTYTIEDAGAGFASIRCGECHNSKPAALVTNDHGSHPADFGKDAACTSCHTGASVLIDIHGNGATSTCSICHSGTPSRDNEFAGNPLNGVDANGITAADGTAAAGSWLSVTCTTCHIELGYELATIHHDNKTDGLVSGGLTDDGTICLRCHGMADALGDHSSSVNIATNCADCHDATKGSTTGIPVLSGNNKVHDTCGTCHEINGSNIVVLVDPTAPANDLVTSMPDGGDAGGTLVGAIMAANTCESCHTAGFTGFHTTSVDHSGMVGQYVNCAACHTGTEAPPGGPVPIEPPVDNKKHDNCEACHIATNGRLIDQTSSSLVSAMPIGSGFGGNDGGGTCFDCHGEYFNNHNAVDHSTTVANVAGECASCHSGSEGMITGMVIDDPVPVPGNMVHDACSTCHTATGVLFTPPSTPNGWATAVNNGGTDGGKDGVGNCKTCHEEYFIKHTHGDPGGHTGVNTDTLCINCHSGDVIQAPFVGPGNAGTHQDNCANCHNLLTGDRVDGSANASSYGGTTINVGDASGDYGSGAGKGGTCDQCHAGYFDSHIHGTPAGTAEHNVFGPTSGTIRQTCDTADCHITTATPYVGTGEVHEITSGGDGCFSCHSNVNGDRVSVAAGNDGATDCLDCHNGKFDNHNGRDTTHDVIMRPGVDDLIPPGNEPCSNCHGADGGDVGVSILDSWDEVLALHTGGCAQCHDSGRSNDMSGYASVQAAIQEDSLTVGCLNCHISRENPHMNHVVYDNGGTYVPAGVVKEDATSCTTCHTGGGTTGTLADSNMMAIHNYSGNGCATCHLNGTATTGGGALIAPYETINSGRGGDCTTCHTTYTNFATGHQNVVQPHAEITNNGSADCVSCHTGDTTGTTGVHTISQTCNNCHTDSATNGTLTFAHQIVPEGGTAKACIDCHSAIDLSFNAHTADTHAARVTAETSCTSKCHTATVISGTHVGTDVGMDPCAVCHVDGSNADGTLQGSALKHSVFQVSTCITCHDETWQAKHENSSKVDHTQEVAVLAGCTDSCHTTTVAALPASIVDGTDGNEIHDACSSCHNADGSVATVTAPKGSDTINVLAPNGGNCGLCHDNQTFETHDHHTTANNQVAYDSLVDRSQNLDDPTTACYQCHNEFNLTNFTGIESEHVTSCARCHNYVGSNDGLETPPEADVTAAFAVAFPTAVSCITCHTPKDHANGASSLHGKHLENDGTFTVVAGQNPCDSCHGSPGSPNTTWKGEVPAGIHSDDCTYCHVNYPTTPASVASAVNGSAAGKIGIKPYDCIDCHTNHFGDNTGGHTHSHAVTVTAACATCHDTGGNLTTGAREANTSPFVESGDVHDNLQCATCHDLGVTNNDGALIDSAASADPAANGNITEYECIDCHTSGWEAIHDASGNVNHITSRVNDTANCNSCHNGSAGAGFKVITSPYESTVDEVHYDHTANVCGTCHTLANDGGLVGSSITAPNMPDSGDCNNCHGTYFYSHTGASHATLITATPCSGCHTGNIISDTSIHNNNCANCHNETNGARVDGSVNAASYRGTAVNVGDASIAAGGDSQWDCGECHSGYFAAHDHGEMNAIDSGIAEHAITATLFCATCHDTVEGGDTTNINAKNAVNAPYTTGGEVHDAGCMTCHDATNGGPKSGTSAANWGATWAAIPFGECITCHNGGFGAHTHHTVANDVTFNATPDQTIGGSPCNTCHTDAGGDFSVWSDIETEHAKYNNTTATDPCLNCHDYATNGNRSGAINTPLLSTVETAISNGNPATCATCHVPKVTVAHGNIDHTTYDGGAGAGVVKGLGTSCVVCHDTAGNDSDAYYIGTIHDISGRSCGTCHRNSGGAGALIDYTTGTGNNLPAPLISLLGDNIDYETATENGGFCDTCHSPYAGAGVSGAHNVKTHTKLANETNCNGCHTETVGADIQGIIHSATGCSGCHDSAGGYVMKALTSAANHTYGSVDTCTGCHNGATSEFDGGTTVHSTGGTETHATMLLGNANCTTQCHQGNVQTTVHSGGLGCQNCHNTAFDGTLINSASGHVKGVSQDCTDCHTAIRDDFTAHTSNTHSNIQGISSQQCTDCHGTTNIMTTIHGNGVTATCTNCHNNTLDNGTLKGSATNHGVGGTSDCFECHTVLNSDFTHTSHTATQDTHSTALGAYAKCTDCHTGDIQTVVHTTCEACHIDTTLSGGTDGRFSNGTTVAGPDGTTSVGNATGHAIGGTSTCLNCHSSYDTDFDGSHIREAPHNDASHSELTGVGAPQCTDCHLVSSDMITGIHNNGCELCHTDVTPAGGEDGSFTGSAVNHSPGGPTNCADCHTGIAANFSAHTSDTHNTALSNYNDSVPSQDCDNCHTEATGTAIQTTTHSTSTCSNCHVDATGTDGRLKNGANGWGDARLADQIIDGAARTASTCVICHPLGYFSSHTYGAAHLNTTYNDVTDQSQIPLAPCADCHDPNSNTLAGWLDIRAEHLNNCLSCHNYDGTTLPEGPTPAADVQSTITGGGGSCAACHTDKLSGQANQEHGSSGHAAGDWNMATSPCDSCHTGQMIGTGVDDLHADCGVCHVESTGGGTVIGSATNLAGGLSNTPCTDCHTGATPDHAAFHHTSDDALLGHCESCHTNTSVDTAVAPRQMNCVNCHVNDTGSALEFVRFDLTRLDASEPVDPRNGIVPSHTITYGAGPATEIYDVRVCFDCHSGDNANFPAAPIVKPFHGYPGDWTIGHLVVGAGQLPGLGQTAPAAYSNGLDDLNNADEVPYFYQWWHPGPGIASGSGVRRFNSTMAYREGANSRQVYKGFGGSSTGTNPTGLSLQDIGKNGNYSFQLGNGESVSGGLQTHANDGTTYQSQLYSQSFNIPCSGTYGSGWCSDGQYTEIPSFPDVASGDVIIITASGYDETGTADLTVEATNTLNNSGEQLSVSFSGISGCAGGNMAYSTDRWTYTCTPTAFTPDGTQTVTVSSDATPSKDATRVINNSSGGGGGPATNTLTTVTAEWKTNGDGAASGHLFITAYVSDNNQFTAAYNADYDQGASNISGAALTWHASGYWMDNASFDNQPLLANVRVWATANGDDQNYTVSDTSDTVTIVSADYDGNAAGGTLSVVATHLYNDGSLTYKAFYNGTDYTMNWTGSQYELNQTSLGGTMPAATVDVHSNEPAEYGGDRQNGFTVTDNTTSDDAITISSATWINNGDGAAAGTLDVIANNTGGDNGCGYTVSYNASNVSMTWVTDHWEGQITGVNYLAGTNTVTIGGLTSPCDTDGDAFPSAGDVTNNSDSVTVGQADHDGSTLTVAATVAGGSCANTYYVDYEGIVDQGPMNCAAGSLTYTWNTPPAYAATNVTVHSGSAGGDSATLAAADTSGGGGGLTDHDTTGNGAVTFAATSTETCANCHSGDTVYDVHKADCSMCHTASPPALVASMPYDVDGTPGIDPIAPGTCGSCHAQIDNNGASRKKTWYHHYSDNAQNGNCVHCHKEAREPGKWESVPQQAPCAYCHTDYSVLDSTGDFSLKTFDFAATGFHTQLNSIASGTHTIPNLAGGPIEIHDYAVCFDCHDGTDNMDGFAFGAPAGANLPPQIRPFHASGMAEDLTLVPQQASDPGTTNPPYVPLDPATAYNEQAAEGDSSNTMNDDQTAPNREDLFFAYHYHPGRGGITDTNTVVLDGGGTPRGSFNILYSIISPDYGQSAGNNNKYYGGSNGDGCVGCGGANYKHVYQDGGTTTGTGTLPYGPYGSDSFATSNNNYNDGVRIWDFSGRVNVPYNLFDPVTNPIPYWVTVPMLPVKVYGTDIPLFPDEVRITSVDCGTGTVEAWTKLTEDFHLGSTATGDVTVSINGGAAQNMTWNGSRWTYSGSCSSGQSIQVDSSMGDGAGTTSTTAP